ncbi:hypothetical protein IQ06DRAFT_296644 [Phaeosphaeriaceae sp. SRC1lsM3a]|nr:hypothetical protein IQ06DRAFT_296644 [Stagonospora sp. SRC1lsM3a]
MTSYFCQICWLDMCIARIRTPEDPPDAARNNEGRDYVSFAPPRDYHGDLVPDEQCQECTTADRTSVNFHQDAKKILSGGPLWDEDEDSDDEWLPDDDTDEQHEPLEYDSEVESEIEFSGKATNDNDNVDDEDGDSSARDALRELPAPEQKMYMPHGT